MALVSIKVSTPTDVDMVAVGSYYAGAHILHVDGSYGGTGAAPEIAKKNIAMPIEFALPKVHKHLLAEGCRAAGVLVWAYCLMPNHTHLIAVPAEPDALRAAVACFIAL